jgi:L,D-transpeptidase ErfK/SrfK
MALRKAPPATAPVPGRARFVVSLRIGRRIVGAIAAALLLAAGACNAQELPRLGNTLVGGEFEHVVIRGESLAAISSRYGIGSSVLARENGLKRYARLKRGQLLRVDNRHIVPTELSDGILINLPQRMLFFFSEGKLSKFYPVGLGRPTWPTPRGPFEVLEMREHPTWNVPESIQREMALEGKIVKKRVPPGHDNPLGDYWIGLSMGAIGIHGTIAPLTVYGFRTHGCIRLHPDDAEELFNLVRVGQSGEIIYEPLLLARLGDGRIFLEVHRDIYNKSMHPRSALRALADFHKLNDMIDWKLAESVIEAREGIARDVSAASVKKSEGVGKVTDDKTLTRRRFVKIGALSLASLWLPGRALAGFRVPGAQERSLSFYNLHTGESLKAAYWEKGRYLPDALREIWYVLRDFRTGEIKPIDSRLLDLLAALRARLDTREPFDVISGYRSPATNAMLAAHSRGVSPRSLHMRGQAIDIRVPGRALSAVHGAAVSLRGGGVGYYPRPDFVHVDVGRVRYW